MKKIVLTGLICGAAATGAFAQGSLNGMTGIFSADGITTPGANAANPSSATTYYSGTVTLALYYSATANSAEAGTINGLDGTPNGTAQALADLNTDGFTLASVPAVQGTTTGAGTYTIANGDVSGTAGDVVGLTGVPTSGSGWLALVVTAVGGQFAGDEAVLVFSQPNFGGNPNTLPTPGFSSPVVQDPAGLNPVLEVVVPEPGTIALAALGGASLLMFRRKK